MKIKNKKTSKTTAMLLFANKVGGTIQLKMQYPFLP